MKKDIAFTKDATHIFHSNSRSVAFTLAEVLITLGIIGVVSAITIPTLMSKYRENVTITKVKKFYSTMQQAQLQSINDNGEVDTWDFVPSGGESNNAIILAWYEKYWGKYLNNVEVIDRKTLNDEGVEVDGGIVVKLADGSIVRFSSFSGGYMHICYYTNYKKFMNNTSKTGADMFLFGFNNTNYKRFDTYGIWVTNENLLKNDYDKGCYSTSTANKGVYCARLLQRNGWKVPSDYPHKF